MDLSTTQMLGKADLLNPARKGLCSSKWGSDCCFSSFSAYTDDMWIKGKENQLAGLTKLRADS